MAWYWIVLIVLGYVAIWLCFTTAGKEDKDAMFECNVVTSFFWPLLIVAGVILLPFIAIDKLADFLNNRL